MTPETVTIAFLLVFIIIRERIVYNEIQKLVDKVISKDFSEYTSCQVDLKQAEKKEPKSELNRMIRI